MKKSRNKRFIKRKVVMTFMLILLINLGFNVKVFSKNITQKAAFENYTTKEYIVKEGDCISIIASKYRKDNEKISNVQERIKYVNNIEETIYPGQNLLIPVSN